MFEGHLQPHFGKARYSNQVDRFRVARHPLGMMRVATEGAILRRFSVRHGGLIICGLTRRSPNLEKPCNPIRPTT